MNSINRARADPILTPHLISLCPLPCSNSAAGFLSFWPSLRVLAAVVLCVCFAVPLAAKGRRATSDLDGNYAAALATANRFLQAWQAQDQENGTLMLSDAAKQHVSEERLEEFFESGPSAAYEIERGKPLKGGRYSFPVTLFGLVSPGSIKTHPHFAQLVVARTGKNEWMIERLPK